MAKIKSLLHFSSGDKVLIVLCILLNAGLFYYFGLGAASGLAIYQQYLIKDRNKQKCIQAFVNNNWFGFCVFMGLFVDYWVK